MLLAVNKAGPRAGIQVLESLKKGFEAVFAKLSLAPEGRPLIYCVYHLGLILDYQRAGLQGATVKLAHFSIKEYLESKRILKGNANEFHLDVARDQKFLAHSCLV